MASSLEEATVPESPNGNQMLTELGTETTKSVFEHFCEYGRERPGIMALWCFGIGFVLGWKLKPW